MVADRMGLGDVERKTTTSQISPMTFPEEGTFFFSGLRFPVVFDK
jgi:hypothetical protein